MVRLNKVGRAAGARQIECPSRCLLACWTRRYLPICKRTVLLLYSNHESPHKKIEPLLHVSPADPTLFVCFVVGAIVWTHTEDERLRATYKTLFLTSTYRCI